MLTNEELDKQAEECKVLYQVNIDHIIAQAKLANELEAKLVKARSDALEEAAKVCDAAEEKYNKREGWKFPENKTNAEYCAGILAEAIRALRKP